MANLVPKKTPQNRPFWRVDFTELYGQNDDFLGSIFDPVFEQKNESFFDTKNPVFESHLNKVTGDGQISDFRGTPDLDIWGSHFGTPREGPGTPKMTHFWAIFGPPF